MKEVFEYASQGRINVRNNCARFKYGAEKSHILVPQHGTNDQVQ